MAGSLPVAAPWSSRFRTWLRSGAVKTLSHAAIQSAADQLVAVREGRLVLSGLPAEVTPEHTADMQLIINAASAQIDRRVGGWKVYTLYKPMNPPVFAPIYDVFPSGAEIPASISPGRLIEPEIMFRVDRDLPAREARYEVDELADAVTAVVGFEIIGSRFSPDASAPGQGSLYGALSDHLANGAIVVGDAITAWRDAAFEDTRLAMYEGGREMVSVVGCHPFDNPFFPVVVGVNRLRRHHGVRAGDIIVTNSSTSFFAVDAGTVVRAVYEGLGEVTATFAHA
jgi:2-keto-4-pentenoate hydratase